MRVEGGEEEGEKSEEGRGGEGWCDGTLTILSEFSGADLRAYREGVFGAEHFRGHIVGCVWFMDTGQCCVLVGTTGRLLELCTVSRGGGRTVNATLAHVITDMWLRTIYTYFLAS